MTAALLPQWKWTENFEKKLNRKIHYYSIKVHPKVSKITKFGWL